MSNPTVSLPFQKDGRSRPSLLLKTCTPSLYCLRHPHHTTFVLVIVPHSLPLSYHFRHRFHTTFVLPEIPQSAIYQSIPQIPAFPAILAFPAFPIFPTFPKSFTFPTLPILLTAIPRSPRSPRSPSSPRPPSSLTTENCQLKTVNCQLMFFVFLCLNNQSLMFFRLKKHQLITDN